MTATTPRRSGLRRISNLPPVIPGAQLMEVEVGGAAYQAPSASGSGGVVWSQVGFSAPLATDFVDLKGHAVTIGGGITNAGGKAVFTGAGVLSYVMDESLAPRDGDFTWRGWFSSSQSQQFTLLVDTDPSTGAGGYAIALNIDAGNDGKVGFYGWTGVATLIVKTTGGFNDGVRHAVAVAKMGTFFMIFIDGVLRGTGTSTGMTASYFPGYPLTLGGRTGGTLLLVGTLDNWEFVRGTAVYTVPFTVPTPPFHSS